MEDVGFESFNAYLKPAQPHPFRPQLRPTLALDDDSTDAEIGEIAAIPGRCWKCRSSLSPITASRSIKQISPAMPTLDALQTELGGTDFQVVPLSIDRAGPDVVREFFAEIGIQHLVLYIDASSFDLAAVGLPTALLIDEEGRELGRLVGPTEWDTPRMIAFLGSHVTSN